jgi:valyl-tRNA synthetase
MVVDGIELFMPLEGLIDLAAERKRLEERQRELQAELGRLDQRLADAQFLARAPKEVVEQARARRADARDTLKKCSAHLAVL